MQPGTWPCPDAGPEYALRFDGGGARLVLVIPALFDEGNKLRRLTVSVMRHLHAAEVASVLPDWPGCNESLAPLDIQTLTGWRAAAAAAAVHFGATHILTVRGGAMLDPGTLPGLRFAAVAGTTILRGLLRGQVIAAREAGGAVTREGLLERGLREGLVLGGYDLGARMVGELDGLALPGSAAREVAQGEVGGGALWLRAEPGDDAAQAARLAELMVEAIG
jgi:hypothetical protein